MLIQSIVTALLSGIFAGAIIFALNERRDRRELLLRKAEEAIAAYSEWVETISNWPNAHFDLFIGDGENGRTKTTEIWDKSRIAYLRAEMLIGIYLPERQHVLADTAESYADFVLVSGRLKLASLEKVAPTDADIEHTKSAGVKIIKAGNVGLKKLFATARQHSLSPFLVRVPFLGRNSSRKAHQQEIE